MCASLPYHQPSLPSGSGALYSEYSLEPRLVLALNDETGVGTPLLPLSSSAAVGAWVREAALASLPDHLVTLPPPPATA